MPYDTRVKDIYAGITMKQYWLNRVTGQVTNLSVNTARRDVMHKYIYSYRSTKAEGKRNKRMVPLLRRHMFKMNPHPCLIETVQTDFASAPTLVLQDQYTPDQAKVYCGENSFAYGVAAQLPSTGYVITCPTGELPITQAHQRALKKQDRMELDLQTNLGELKETVVMIHDLLLILRNPLQLWLKPGLAAGSRKKMLEILSDGWLTYRYGIMPAVYSIADLVKILSGMNYVRFRITKGSHEPVIWEKSEKLLIRSGMIYFESKKETKEELKATVIITAQQKVSMLSTLGLDASQIPLVALELTRWSFVLEWFIGLSDYLRTVIPDGDLSIHNVQLCDKRVKTEKYTPINSYYQVGNKIPCSSGEVTQTLSRLTRTINPYIPRKLLPGTGLNSLKKALDAIALWRQPVMRDIYYVRKQFKRR